jgi:hypothetical protein
MSKHYCNSKELEEWWAGWLATGSYNIIIEKNKKGKSMKRINFINEGDSRNWKKMTEMLYDICLGIAKKFRPVDSDEYHNLANEAMIKLMDKIKKGKLNFIPTSQGGSPIFNLVTTTVHNILCSYKNYHKNHKIRHSKYVIKTVQEKAPELMPSVMSLYE